MIDSCFYSTYIEVGKSTNSLNTQHNCMHGMILQSSNQEIVNKNSTENY